MIMKVIEDNGAIFNSNTHVNKEAAFQCYNIGTRCYYGTGANNPLATYITLTPLAYTIREAKFYTSQY
jgi:hypothetical protein